MKHTVEQYEDLAWDALKAAGVSETLEQIDSCTATALVYATLAQAAAIEEVARATLPIGES